MTSTDAVSPSQTALRILVVDDNVDAADSLAMLIRQFSNHTVSVAYSGMRAIQVSQNFRPDVILLDIGLPSISGFEVAASLRQMPETKDVVIVAITGYCQPSDRKASQAAGINLHLSKPVDIKHLFSYLGASESITSPSR